jgi:hypothetical protein
MPVWLITPIPRPTCKARGRANLPFSVRFCTSTPAVLIGASVTARPMRGPASPFVAAGTFVKASQLRRASFPLDHSESAARLKRNAVGIANILKAGLPERLVEIGL